MDTQNEANVVKSKFNKLSAIVLLVTIILSSVVFSTNSQVPLDSAKMITIFTGIILSGILYFISVFSTKTLYIPKHSSTYAILLVVISTVISTFVSKTVSKSFFGQGFEIGTGSFVLLMFFLLFLVVQLVYKNKERLYYIYSSFFAGFLLLVLFHLIRLFDVKLLSFGVFNSSVSSLIGRWTDLGVYSGLIFIISFISLNLVSLSGIRKAFVWLLFILSLVVLVLVNNPFIWLVLAISTVSYFVYNYVYNSKKGLSKISIPSLILSIAFIVFTFWGSILSPISKSLNVQQGDINLPWQLALDISSDTLKQKPIFGAGPNKFGNEFLLNKPQELNQTMFWNVDFSTGFSYVTNFVVTNGVLGIVSWLLLLILLLNLGIRNLRNQNEDSGRFAITSTFFGSLFIWLMLSLYNPSHFIVFSAFIMIGLFISTSAFRSFVNVKEITRGTVIISSIVIIVLCAWLFASMKKAVALSYFQSGISQLSSSANRDLDKIEGNFLTAVKWDGSDVFYQALSEISLLRVNELTQQLQAKNTKTPDQETIKKIGELIEKSVGYSNMAIKADPSNHYNYVSLARVSELASTLQIPNAYENAKVSYANAISLNPYNPALYLSLARLEASKNNVNDAQRYIGSALQLKQNYIEAIFFLAQLQVSQGQIKEAITSVQVATQINPNDPLLFFQLGFLYYNDKNYLGAVDALSKAVTLNDQYANARYFLGLSYVRLGKNVEAIQQFEKILETNSDNQEVQFILTNLKSGKSPFADVKPPVDSKPEQRKTLPVKEKAVETSKTKVQK